MDTTKDFRPDGDTTTKEIQEWQEDIERLSQLPVPVVLSAVLGVSAGEIADRMMEREIHEEDFGSIFQVGRFLDLPVEKQSLRLGSNAERTISFTDRFLNLSDWKSAIRSSIYLYDELAKVLGEP